MIPVCTLWKHKNTFGFLLFEGDIEMEHNIGVKWVHQTWTIFQLMNTNKMYFPGLKYWSRNIGVRTK